MQGRLNRVEKATDFSPRIVGILAALDSDRKHMRSSFPPELSRLVARKPDYSAGHDPNGGKISTYWEGMH